MKTSRHYLKLAYMMSHVNAHPLRGILECIMKTQLLFVAGHQNGLQVGQLPHPNNIINKGLINSISYMYS